MEKPAARRFTAERVWFWLSIAIMAIAVSGFVALTIAWGDPFLAMYRNTNPTTATLLSVPLVVVSFLALNSGAGTFITQATLAEHAWHKKRTGKDTKTPIFVLLTAAATAMTELDFVGLAVAKNQTLVLFVTITGSDLLNLTLIVGLNIMRTKNRTIDGMALKQMRLALALLVLATLLVTVAGMFGYTRWLALIIGVICATSLWRFAKTAPTGTLEEPEGDFDARGLMKGFTLMTLNAPLFQDSVQRLLTALSASSGFVGVAQAFAATLPELLVVWKVQRGKEQEKSLLLLVAMAVVSNVMDSLGAQVGFIARPELHASMATAIEGASPMVALLLVLTLMRRDTASKWAGITLVMAGIAALIMPQFL